MRPWLRRLLTRMLAIVPAIFVIGRLGESRSVTDLINLSQVVLGLLLLLTSSRKVMGKHRNGAFLLLAGWTTCIVITALDIYGLPEATSKAWEVILG
jgi:manganese transport protein